MDPVTSSPTATSAPATDSALHFLDYWRIIRIRKTVILAVFLLVVMTATLVTFILPVAYDSTARLKVEGDVTDVAPFGENFKQRSQYDPYFLQTEFEFMQSEVILERVIDKLKLNEVWAEQLKGGKKLKTQETMLQLRRKLEIRPSRNTSLIEIRVFSDKPAEAAAIANTLAETYRDYRKEIRRERSMNGINALQARLDNMNERIKAKEDEVDKLRIELKVTDEQIASATTGSLLEYKQLQQLATHQIELQTAYAKVEGMYNELNALPKETLRRAILTVVNDALLQDHLQNLAYAQTKYITLTNDYGPSNPEVARMAAQVQDLDRKADERVAGIMTGLRTQVAYSKAELESLQQSVAKAKKVDMDMAERVRPYIKAKRELETLMTFREVLDRKTQSELIDRELPMESMVVITDRAKESEFPVKPNKPLNIILGVVIGLIVGVGLAFFIEYLDTSVKTIDEVERALQAPVLGVIPQNVGYLINEGTESPHAESYRVLRTNLLFARKDEKFTSIVVISAGAGEGKSTTVFNLATIFAMHGSRVVLVDSDLRRPTIHKIMGVSNSIGLTNFLLRQNTLEEVIQTTKLPTFDIVPSGKLPSSSMGILNSKAMRDLIQELKQRYDFVFFDSPPMVGLSDASILCSEMDLTMQVIQYRRYPQPMTIRAKQMIEKVGGRLVGIVLNNINMSQDEYYYYYSGYYSDYYSHNADEESNSKDKPKEGDKNVRVEIKQKY